MYVPFSSTNLKDVSEISKFINQISVVSEIKYGLNKELDVESGSNKIPNLLKDHLN